MITPYRSRLRRQLLPIVVLLLTLSACGGPAVGTEQPTLPAPISTAGTPGQPTPIPTAPPEAQPSPQSASATAAVEQAPSTIPPTAASAPTATASAGQPTPAATGQHEIALVEAGGDVMLLRGADRGPLAGIKTDPVAGDALSAQPNGCEDDTQIAWSPDGYRLALPYGIWTLSDDPHAPAVHSPIDGWDFRWSPDGQRLAWLYALEEHADALVLGRPDGDDAQIAATAHWGTTGRIAWSPDGQYIIGGIELLARDGSGAAIAPPEQRDKYAAWSPDGQRMAWTNLDGDESTLTMTITLWESAQPTTLATLSFASTGGFPYSARPRLHWLPDGSGVLIPIPGVAPGDDGGTWLIGLDGANRRVSPAQICDLSPDGQQMLARTEDSHIVIVRLANGEVEADLGVGLAAAWRPEHRGPPPDAPLATKSPTLSLTTPPTHGSAVTELQQQLKALGYDVGTVDGVYGARTAAAVRRFQQDHELTVDGIAGPKTWALLRARSLKPPNG